MSCFFQFLASEALPLHENIHHCRFRWIEQLLLISPLQFNSKKRSVILQKTEKKEHQQQPACWQEQCQSQRRNPSNANEKKKKKAKKWSNKHKSAWKPPNLLLLLSAAAVVPFAASSSSSSYFCHISSSYRSAQVRQLAEDLQFYCFSDLDPLLPFCLTEMIAELVIDAAHNGNSDFDLACSLLLSSFLSPLSLCVSFFLSAILVFGGWNNAYARENSIEISQDPPSAWKLLRSPRLLPPDFAVGPIPRCITLDSQLFMFEIYGRRGWSLDISALAQAASLSSTAGATSTASDLSLAWQQLPLHSFPGLIMATWLRLLFSIVALFFSQASFFQQEERLTST